MTNPSPEPSPQAGAHPGQAQISVTLRYFAAATEAAGRPEERLDLPAGTTLAALREQLSGRGLEMARVIPICSFLVKLGLYPGGLAHALADGDAVDVLPPFAGG